MDFIAARDNIKTVLGTDAGIATFCQATYKKNITVIKGAKQKESTGLDKFPIIYLTDGQELATPTSDGETLNKIDVLVIAGIHQAKPALAIDEIYRLQELIISALEKDICRGGNAIDSSFISSASDFEASAPRHFRAIRFTLTMIKNY